VRVAQTCFHDGVGRFFRNIGWALVRADQQLGISAFHAGICCSKLRVKRADRKLGEFLNPGISDSVPDPKNQQPYSDFWIVSQPLFFGD
jgi:hypothetical protein